MGKAMAVLAGGTIIVALGGCNRGNPVPARHEVAMMPKRTAVADDQKPQAISLLGRPLFAPALSPDVLAKRQRELEEAQFEYDRNLHDENAIIWLGRRQAYLGQYQDAINTFSNGLAIHPDSSRLLRHRGHRHITTRKFDLALVDLQRAAELIRVGGPPDEIEPDGQPNKLNIPTSTTHTNIYYHLGLARYLTGDFSGAADAYWRCMEFATNDDMRVATAYWLYLSLRRLHEDDQAAAALKPIRDQMDIIENSSYHRLLLMFKGSLSEDEAAKPTGEDESIDVATTGYGIGMWHLLRGEREAAMEQFRKVIANSSWAAFGHIAAEAELAHK